MIRIAIVEDEQLYADQLAEYMDRFMKETGEQIRLTFFHDGEDIAVSYKPEYDIILMDIQMQFMDGMTAAEKIRALDQKVIIMFITNMMQYAIRGYQVDALDYIVKPVSYFSFAQKLQRAINRLPKDDVHAVTVNSAAGVYRIIAEDIYYIESEGHSLIFHTKGGDYRERGKMQDREEELAPVGFFRSNKGYLVNLDAVDGVQDGCRLVHGQKLLIARARKNEFLTALAQHMG
jgi:DNA-binding LytR/AlgR family response regulator